MSLLPYPKYKDSGVAWLGEVPAHWDIKRLKHICYVFPSNIDKKSYDDETPVSLCNYTAVYYNDKITASMEFMRATASTAQIAKFTLRAGDTIITKDSETADDIAIGAYVPEDLPNVVCGYHLSMIRPKSSSNGAFIKQLFDSTFVKSCVAVRANGLTRVGLGQYEIDNLELPFPPLDEQGVEGKSISLLNRDCLLAKFPFAPVSSTGQALSLSKGNSWFDKLTTNGFLRTFSSNGQSRLKMGNFRWHDFRQTWATWQRQASTPRMSCNA
jgi:hypothetical protein